MKILLVLLCIAPSILAANILVLNGVDASSHNAWFRTLLVELIAKEHNITSINVIISHMELPNIHDINLEEYESVLKPQPKIDYVELGRMSSWQKIAYHGNRVISGCEEMVKSEGFIKLLNYPSYFKFDLVLYDYLLQPCLLAFYHKFNYPPMIAITAAGFSSVKRYNGHFTPFEAHPFSNGVNSMSVFGRIKNALLYNYDYLYKLFYVNPKIEAILAPYIQNGSTLCAMERMEKLVMVNTHPAIESAEPMLPNVIPVGGLHIREPRIMSVDLEKIAAAAINGIVIFSLGGNVGNDTLSQDHIKAIIETFRKLPDYTFLWKQEFKDKSTEHLPPNVIARPWIPQQDILGHKNTILFITNGGTLSIQEAIWHGVPVLGIPIFDDQFHNIHNLQQKGAAKMLRFEHLNAKNLRKSIQSVLGYKKYETNAKKLSKLFRDQPQKPMERALWWIDWVMRNSNDTDILRASIQQHNILQKQGVDVMAFIIITCLASVFISLKLSLKCMKKVFCKRNLRKEKSKKN